MEAPPASQHPLLQNLNDELSSEPKKTPKTPGQKVVRKTLKKSAFLSNLLPTGTVLVFQVVSPVVTNQGKCRTDTAQTLTLGFLTLTAISCFFMSFTDSVRDTRGKVRYGVATFKGLYVMDGSVEFSDEDAAKYRLRFIDFVHAVMSLLVFVAVAMFDQNVVNCFCPAPSEEVKEVLAVAPAAIGVVCSLFFVAFPTRRHGIGFPLSRE